MSLHIHYHNSSLPIVELWRKVYLEKTSGEEQLEVEKEKNDREGKESGLLLHSPKKRFSYCASHKDLQLSARVPSTNLQSQEVTKCRGSSSAIRSRPWSSGNTQSGVTWKPLQITTYLNNTLFYNCIIYKICCFISAIISKICEAS